MSYPFELTKKSRANANTSQLNDMSNLLVQPNSEHHIAQVSNHQVDNDNDNDGGGQVQVSATSRFLSIHLKSSHFMSSVEKSSGEFEKSTFNIS